MSTKPAMGLHTFSGFMGGVGVIEQAPFHIMEIESIGLVEVYGAGGSGGISQVLLTRRSHFGHTIPASTVPVRVPRN